MRKVVTILAATTAVAFGAGVLFLKMAVQTKVDNVKEIAQQIKQDREAIRVLEAEWAYLTTPYVLQDRSIQFLALMPPRAKQIVTNPGLIPFRPKGIDVTEEGSILRPASKEIKPPKKVAKPKAEEQSL